MVEHRFRPRPFARKLRLRVDLHGVSMFMPDGRHTLIRWEWIQHIGVDGGIVVRGPSAEIAFPPGAFGLPPDDLADRLRAAVSIHQRAEVLAALAR